VIVVERTIQMTESNPSRPTRHRPPLLLIAGLITSVCALWSSSSDFRTGGIGTFLLLGLLCVLTIFAVAADLSWRRQNAFDSTGEKVIRVRRVPASIALIVITTLTIVAWRNILPLRLRFTLLQSDLEQEAQSILTQPYSTREGSAIVAGLPVRAIINDEQGLWLRTFAHPDGVWGFFKSRSGKPPEADDPGEVVGGRSLGDDWYFYLVRWD